MIKQEKFISPSYKCLDVASGVAQVFEHLLSELETRSSGPSTTTKRKKQSGGNQSKAFLVKISSVI
jgi:hypothetical protein